MYETSCNKLRVRDSASLRVSSPSLCREGRGGSLLSLRVSSPLPFREGRGGSSLPLCRGSWRGSCEGLGGSLLSLRVQPRRGLPTFTFFTARRAFLHKVLTARRAFFTARSALSLYISLIYALRRLCCLCSNCVQLAWFFQLVSKIEVVSAYFTPYLFMYGI